LKGTLNIAEFAPKEVLERLAVNLPATSDPQVLRKASLSTQLTANPKAANLSQLKMVLDDSNVTGGLQARLNEQTDIGFDLAMNQIDLDRYLPPPTQETQHPQTTAPPADQPAAPDTGKSEPAADPFAW